MSWVLKAGALLGLLFVGAIFGFFYAWVCSTMWGLDAIDPEIAISAMNGMNGSVRNGVFAPAFFGTPFILWAVAYLARREGFGTMAICFALAGVIYFFGGIVLTVTNNVPMNEALMLERPKTPEEAREIWQTYSGTWQVFNMTRTVFSGLSLLSVGMGLLGARSSAKGVI